MHKNKSYFGTAPLVIAMALMISACGGSSGSGAVPLGPIKYATLNYPNGVTGSSTFLTGIRGVDNSSDVYISGIYTPTSSMSDDVGLLYKGPITGGGSWNILNYPSSPGVTVTTTSLYGPNNNGTDAVTVVGNYTTQEQGGAPIGAMYQGPIDGTGTWTTIMPPGAVVCIPHSNMGGFVVGNYDTSQVVVTGKVFIYDITNQTYSFLTKTGASLTAYGIWYNGGTSYTITGGLTENGTVTGYLVDWDSSTQTASNWTTFTDPKAGTNLVTHFEGITTDGSGGYNLAADDVDINSGIVERAAFANVPRLPLGDFGTATWRRIDFPNSTVTSSNTVFTNHILGVYQMGTDVSNGFVATLH